MARRDAAPGVDGVLVVNKPPGPTSHDVVALVRRLSGTRRVGHGGTLDPFASGVLPVFLGQATRLVEYHAADRKQYRATVCFGSRSSTDDLDGELVPVDGPAPDREAVVAGLARLTGTIEQRPPSHSAVRVGGRRAYALARAGETPELRPRTVTIDRLELVGWDDSDPARPVAIVDVDCSPGTYVRSIARDLGEQLGSGAYLCALVRTASGPFRLEDAVGLDDLRAAASEGPAAFVRLLKPIDEGLDGLPRVELTGPEVADVAQGRFVRPASSVPDVPADRPVRLVGPGGRLVGIGLRRGARLVPTKVLAGPATGASAPGALAPGASEPA